MSMMMRLDSADRYIIDEMMENENHSLLMRVEALEALCRQQTQEITFMQGSLNEALRRIDALESRRLGMDASRPSSAASLASRTRELNIRQPSNRQPAAKRTAKSAQSNLANRHGYQHQSTGSLQSDSAASSSASISPAPSPSPRATPHHGFAAQRLRPDASANNQTPKRDNSLTKRWNSTGDFNAKGLSGNSRFTTTKSLLNLNAKPSNGLPIQRHGTQTCQYNEDEGSLRMYLRGRPVVLYAPTDTMATLDPSKVAPPPQNKLKLEWVYGYRGKDCRSNLYLLPTGEIVYFVASVAVLFNVDEQCQRHYTGHTDDIKCLAVHPNKLVVATGQCAGHDRVDARPHVRVWNSVSLTTLAVIGVGHFESSVACLSFSKADGGSQLVCVDEGPEHSLTVWDWQRTEKKQCVAEAKYVADTVITAEFHPLDRSQIVTCGKNHIAFWTLDNTNVLYKRMGVFDGRDKPKYVTCLAFNSNGDVISGDSNGNILVWARGTNTVSGIRRNVHEGSIFSICTLKEGHIVTAGGKDGKLQMFDMELNFTGMQCQVDSHFGGVRVVAEGRGNQLFIGTTKNCILYGDMQNGFVPAVLGHVEELWGLACHPSLPQFITAGWDCLLQLWDGLHHSTVWSKDIGERAQCCAWSHDGKEIVVGCLSGTWLVFDPETRDLKAQHQDGAEPIQTIQFSPDNNLLALGSRDNFIYVYQVDTERQRYSRLGKCVGHSSYITHLDWSEDSQYIRSNSGDYELLYWNSTTCRQVTSPTSLRDVTWATTTCPLTFHTVGVWPENADGTDINSCTRSHDGRLTATGDDFGKVKLFAYPVSQPKSLSHQYGGHSSHVTCVRFLPDDTRLVSTGGLDTSVMQWVID